MIWAFRRGVVGVVVNLLIGVAGALFAALLSYLVVPLNARGEDTTRLLFAAGGAIAVPCIFIWCLDARGIFVVRGEKHLGRQTRVPFLKRRAGIFVGADA